MGGDRCASAGCGQLGGATQQSQDMALQFPWAGRGTAGGGARTYLSGSVLERIGRRSVEDRRGNARALCRALRATARYPRCVRTVRRVSTGRCGQPCVSREGKAHFAGARAGRREILWRGHGDGTEIRRDECEGRRYSGVRPLGDGRKPGGDDEPRCRFSDPVARSPQSPASGDRVIDQQHNYGADHRHKGGIEEAAFGGVAQRLKQCAAYQRAHESEGDVDQTAFAPAVDDAAGDEAAHESDNDPTDNMHEKSAPLFEPKMVTPLLERKGQRENQAIATVAPAMTAVESQPRPARPIPAVNWPISFRLPTTT